MREFDHHSPQNLIAALDLLAELDGRARVIAGGSDLVPQMRAGVVTLDALVNIKRVDGLAGVAYNEHTGLRLGTLVTLRELSRSKPVRDRYPSLAEAASLIASEQIRSFATMGGNVCNASPAADLPPSLIVLGATAHLVSRELERHVPLEDFFTGPGATVLRPGELLKEIRLPPPAGRAAYVKHSRRRLMDLAVVGVAARLEMDGQVCRQARIALGAVAPVPLRASEAEAELRGQAIDAERIARAADAAAAACSCIDDARASASYRSRMVEVIVRRTLTDLSGVAAPR